MTGTAAIWLTVFDAGEQLAEDRVAVSQATSFDLRA